MKKLSSSNKKPEKFSSSKRGGDCKTLIPHCDFLPCRCVHALPFDSTRVVLRSGGYINASWVSLPGGGGESVVCIAAQGPMRATAEDFWRMARESGVGQIVALANVEEKERGEEGFELWVISNNMSCFLFVYLKAAWWKSASNIGRQPREAR